MAPALSMLRAAVALALSACATGDEVVESDANTTKPYEPVSVEGLHWAETFDGDVFTRWKMSTAEKYNGKWKVDKRAKEALVGDLGLLAPEEAKHYGIASTFAPIEGQKDVPFAVQFEAKFQDGLSCGGSYVKLFDSEGKDATEFKDDTPYVIMFGPDKCGGTNKVHFILRHRNPVSGQWEEKHNSKPPSVPSDANTHLYALVIQPDNSFEILVDGETKTSGSLLTSMEPPINPPKEIDDPDDSKPADWVDEAKMDDPAARKPDDWDEDAPLRIDDPAATKPAGWNDDAPLKIPDPEALKPEDWDDEEDGEWEAPAIENPACKVGCGKWEPAKIANPAYKGKWYAPKIDNPEYKGVWKPRQIENPNYFVDETPSMLPAISGVGIDIWTMSKGIMFDNIVISKDVERAKAFADETFQVRRRLEDLQNPKPKLTGTVWDYIDQYGYPALVTGVLLLIASIWFRCCRADAAPPAPAGASKKKAEPSATSEEKSEATEKEEKSEETEAKGEAKKGEGGGLNVGRDEE